MSVVVCSVCVVCAWCVCGVFVVCSWCVHGVCVERDVCGLKLARSGLITVRM